MALQRGGWAWVFDVKISYARDNTNIHGRGRKAWAEWVTRMV